MPDRLLHYRAAAVRDAAGLDARPGVVAVRDRADGTPRVVAAGGESDVRTIGGAPDQTLDLGDCLLLPAMVNAHAHLDLSLIGPMPHRGDFVSWIAAVMRHRQANPHPIARAVEHGLTLLRAGGVGWVGDIAGSIEAAAARVAAPPDVSLPGASWIECLGRGTRADSAFESALRAVDANRDAATRAGVRLALQPHAPYSTDASLYARAETLGLPATHLAETPEEDRFVRDAAGPFADFLRQIGRWDDAIRPQGVSPVRWLFERAAPARAGSARWLLAHCNYVDDDDIALLAARGASVAYCPIASEYYGHPHDRHPAHRYRDMLAAGVNVCLGTDSILCQPPAQAQPLSILPAMRRLFLRDDADPALLLAMATTRGLAALGLDPAHATFTPGVPARFTAVRFDPRDAADPLRQVLANRYPAFPLF